MEIPVKLEAFEGPLDLLLHLIEKNKVNIYDIPIALITEQYMEHLKAMQENHMDNMSEFLVMAATLLRIKSAMLLPAEVDENEEEIDPRQELVEKLLEYKMYKFASLELKDRQLDAERRLYKPETIPEEVAAYKEDVKAEDLIGDTTLLKLNAIFEEILRRQENKIDPIRSKFGRIEKEEVNFQEKVRSIQEYGISHRKFRFRRLLEKAGNKLEIIVTFLGILELMKMGRVLISQTQLFEDFEIEFLANDVVPIEQYL